MFGQTVCPDHKNTDSSFYLIVFYGNSAIKNNDAKMRFLFSLNNTQLYVSDNYRFIFDNRIFVLLWFYLTRPL